MKMSRLALILITLMMAALLVACSTHETETYQSTASQAQADRQGKGRYYDFNDILVPSGMSLRRDKSVLFNVSDMKAGVIMLTDNVDADSLFNFFLESMARDAWTLMGSNKYPTSSLFYAKPGKTCVIHIERSAFTTDVAIWVSPTL